MSSTVISKDGTSIAFDKIGSGPALILVPGLFEQRTFEADTSLLAAYPLLAEHFTIYHYDRRGRGESTDTLPYTVEREIEDIAALIDAAGGTAFLSGISSGAALALEAALKLGSKVKALALYEPPYNDAPEARQGWRMYRQALDATLAEGRNSDAVDVAMGLFGVPPEQLAEMHNYPVWGMWEAIAPTLAYDGAVIGEEAAVPTERAATLATPTLVMSGTETYPFMPVSADTLAKAIPNAQRRVLEGQAHEVKPEAIAPVLVEFFSAR